MHKRRDHRKAEEDGAWLRRLDCADDRPQCPALPMNGASRASTSAFLRHWLGGSPRLVSWSLCGAFVLTGCHAGNHATNTDPLLGPAVPPPPAAKAAAAPPPGASTNPPPIPTGFPSPTNAALAAGSPSAVGNDRNVRLSDSNHTATASWQGQTGAAGVTLRGPDTGLQPIAGRDPGTPGATAMTAGPQPDTYGQLQAQLAQRGVTWQSQQYSRDRDEWKFSCSVPSPSDPKKSRTYEARAHECLTAIRAVIDQIDKER